MSHCCLSVMCYIQGAEKHWYDYTVALNLLLYLAITSVYIQQVAVLPGIVPPILGVVVLQDGLCCVQSPCLPVLV